MIWKLAQTEAGFSNSYVFYDGEGAVAGAKQPNNIVLGGTVFYTHTDGRVYRLGYQAGGQIGNLKKETERETERTRHETVRYPRAPSGPAL